MATSVKKNPPAAEPTIGPPPRKLFGAAANNAARKVQAAPKPEPDQPEAEQAPGTDTLQEPKEPLSLAQQLGVAAVLGPTNGPTDVLLRLSHEQAHRLITGDPQMDLTINEVQAVAQNVVTLTLDRLDHLEVETERLALQRSILKANFLRLEEAYCNLRMDQEQDQPRVQPFSERLSAIVEQASNWLPSAGWFLSIVAPHVYDKLTANPIVAEMLGRPPAPTPAPASPAAEATTGTLDGPPADAAAIAPPAEPEPAPIALVPIDEVPPAPEPIQPAPAPEAPAIAAPEEVGIFSAAPVEAAAEEPAPLPEPEPELTNPANLPSVEAAARKLHEQSVKRWEESGNPNPYDTRFLNITLPYDQLDERLKADLRAQVRDMYYVIDAANGDAGVIVAGAEDAPAPLLEASVPDAPDEALARSLVPADTAPDTAPADAAPDTAPADAAPVDTAPEMTSVDNQDLTADQDAIVAPPPPIAVAAGDEVAPSDDVAAGDDVATADAVDAAQEPQTTTTADALTQAPAAPTAEKEWAMLDEPQ